MTDSTSTLAPAPTTDANGAAPNILDRYERYTLSEFVRLNVQRKKWAVTGIWPENASGIIHGAPKDGKSTISEELGISLATGTPFLNTEEFSTVTPPARVGYVQIENSAERVRKDIDEILVARGLGYMDDVTEGYTDEKGRDHFEVIGQRFQPTWGTYHDWEPDLEIIPSPAGMNLTHDEDQEWLLAYAEVRDYIFLDPAYLLAGVNPNDTGAAIELLGLLTRAREKCSLIITHQTTNKHQEGSAASRMLGSTLFQGWYESAISVKRRKDGSFTIETDNLREMGEERKIHLQGLGTGNWLYIPDAQDQTDSLGRSAPQTAQKKVRQEQIRSALEEDPSMTNEDLRERFGVTVRTIERDREEIERGFASDSDSSQ